MAGLLYPDEHVTCYNYKLSARANFSLVHYDRNMALTEVKVDHSTLMFALQGGGYITLNGEPEVLVHPGEMIFIPCNTTCYIRIPEESMSLMFSFVSGMDFCERFSFEQLVAFLPFDFCPHVVTLAVKGRLRQFLVFLTQCLQDGLECNHFHEINAQQVFMLLRAYYRKEDLACLFHKIIGQQSDFKDFVLAHYLEADTVNELAALANMGVHTFRRRFRETFGESVGKWMIHRKSEHVYRDLKLSDKTFAEIAEEYHMSSQSYLSNFCRQHFEKTPQEIRALRESQ